MGEYVQRDEIIGRQRSMAVRQKPDSKKVGGYEYEATQ